MTILLAAIVFLALLILRSTIVAFVVTGLIWMFVSGVKMLMKPKMDCTGLCLYTANEESFTGYIFVASPIMFLCVWFIFKIMNK